MDNYEDALLSIKRGFLIIGLTGFTGSGCTTAANILCDAAKIKIPNKYLSDLTKREDSSAERRFDRLTSVWEDIAWKKFTIIEASTVIFSLLVKNIAEHKTAVNDLLDIYVLAYENERIRGLRHLGRKDNLSPADAQELVIAYEECTAIYSRFKRAYFRDKPLFQFISQMQDWGDLIRKYGTPVPSPGLRQCPENMFIIPEAIRRIISAYKRCGCTHFVIDAFRNPFEVEYFKRRYSEFYLVAILRKADKRREALSRLSLGEIRALELRERGKTQIMEVDRETGEAKKGPADSPNSTIPRLNVDECIRKADVFIDNIDGPTRPHLKFHLTKLISLANRPGCIQPTSDERGMQLAMTARQMSGCLSRQVGAAVIGKAGYALGIGWNDPPEGQIPCALRTCKELARGSKKEIFSDYERDSEFTNHITQTKGESNEPFCFKSELSIIKDKKQSEYTRALHAEENAFLQIAKVGGPSVVGSILFTTASTCTLCAKKSYQLGIERIVFIEEYPDLAHQQTLAAGTRSVSFDQFEGITGAAYFKLYSPLLPEKDMQDLRAAPT